MQKQIRYPTIVNRMFAVAIDLFLIASVTTPLTNFLSPKVFALAFKDIIVGFGMNLNDPKIETIALRSQEFASKIDLASLLCYILPMLILQIIIVGTYFIWCWHNKTWTPGKYILSMRVVDAETLGNPSIVQCIKRLFGLLLAPVGLWSIFFTEKHQAMHDKVSDTMVIKT